MSQHTATPPKRGRVFYTRYVVGTAKESPRLQSGVITELRLLQETGNLTKGEYKQVGELFEWLN